jgi:hypothetical protein
MQLRKTLFLSLLSALVLVSAQSSSPTPTVSLTPQEVYSEEIARQSAAAAATSLASQLGLSTLSFASVDTAKYTGVPSSSIPGGYQGDTSGLGWTTVTGTAVSFFSISFLSISWDLCYVDGASVVRNLSVPDGLLRVFYS